MRLILFIICALLILQQGANAQFLWQVEHSDFDGRYYYGFDAISCWNNNCTVAGELYDTLNRQIIRMCWRSNDGGLTWKMLDPKLQPYTGVLPHLEYFSIVEQIDSLNIIAGGDAGLLIRSFDGGNTWQKQDPKTEGTIRDVSFSDSLNGIILSQESAGISEGAVRISTTSDGGRNWNAQKFKVYNPNLRGDFSSCRAYTNGKFRLFKSYNAVVYTTIDNWQSIDSTKPLFDTINDPQNYYQLTRCNLSLGDTIIAYGVHYTNGNYIDGEGILFRSTDAGVTWGKSTVFTGMVFLINHMTSLDRDTVIAAGESLNKILMSTDRGESWRVDSLLLDTSYTAYSNNGVAWTDNSNPIAIFTYRLAQDGIPSIIVKSNSMRSRVETIDIGFEKVYLYPNPASSFVNIISVDPLSPIIVIDVLGREVLRSSTTEQGNLKLDVSSLPLGVYDILLARKGALFFVQKLNIYGK